MVVEGNPNSTCMLGPHATLTRTECVLNGRAHVVQAKQLMIAMVNKACESGRIIDTVWTALTDA